MNSFAHLMANNECDIKIILTPFYDELDVLTRADVLQMAISELQLLYDQAVKELTSRNILLDQNW